MYVPLYNETELIDRSYNRLLRSYLGKSLSDAFNYFSDSSEHILSMRRRTLR